MKMLEEILRVYIYMYIELNYPKYIRFDKNIKEMIIALDKDDPVDAWNLQEQKLLSNIKAILIMFLK